MIVREAYRNVTHRICRGHYDAADLDTPMGPVDDARFTGCEWCERERGVYDDSVREVDVDAARIRALREEAGAAGDLDQVAICDRALDGDDDATAECARVIADAEAMED